MTAKHNGIIKSQRDGRANVKAHRMVRDVAVAFARELYVEMMHDNTRYDEWKRQCPDLSGEWLENEWVRLCWPTMLKRARHTLAQTLQSATLPELAKEDIARALMQDAALRRGEIKTRVLQ